MEWNKIKAREVSTECDTSKEFLQQVYKWSSVTFSRTRLTQNTSLCSILLKWRPGRSNSVTRPASVCFFTLPCNNGCDIVYLFYPLDTSPYWLTFPLLKKEITWARAGVLWRHGEKPTDGTCYYPWGLIATPSTMTRIQVYTLWFVPVSTQWPLRVDDYRLLLSERGEVKR